MVSTDLHPNLLINFYNELVKSSELLDSQVAFFSGATLYKVIVGWRRTCTGLFNVENLHNQVQKLLFIV